MKSKSSIRILGSIGRLVAAFGLFVIPSALKAAGVLLPVSQSDSPLLLESHHVKVIINNGFAKTVVEQTFLNLNPHELEAIYQTPIPEQGALSELTIWAGETVLRGEVVAKAEADRIYDEEKQAGNRVAKAEQDGFRKFEFSVYPVPANGSARMRYVYYEPLPVDTGVGKYVYRLEEGGTDEEIDAFWTSNDVVEKDFSVEVLLKSSSPVSKTRVPGFNGDVELIDEKTVRYSYSSQQGSHLDQDFVFYYMLEENLPGRLEMATYRESEDVPGTFMLVMTPGIDLQPLSGGADYVFAIDVSGSMSGKLRTLASGVKKAIGELKPQDRFRIVAFNDIAWDVTGDWTVANPENVATAISQLDGLKSNGGTNVYEGVELGIRRMDSDRVSSLVLITDGVTNQGIVDPRKFYKLLHEQDVRFFGFLLGNSSNWPLMQAMCDASGGYYRSVSNADDIVGEILLAKNKIVYESMHDAALSITGVETFDVSEFTIGKIHYGDQLIFFGRYGDGGTARVTLGARVSGEGKVYQADIEFPDTDVAHPELERMWALDQIQKIQLNESLGFLDSIESKKAIRDIGVAYQIVSDETSMIALDDARFAERGIERRNQERVEREAVAAVANPSSSGAKRVDTQQPMYSNRSPSLGGGGSLGPWSAVASLLLLAFVAGKRLGRRAKAGIAVLALGLVLGIGSVDSYANESVSTTRRASAVQLNNSIDQSLANFREISEEEDAESERPVRRIPEPLRLSPSEDSRHVVVERVVEKDTHKVNQSRRKDGSSGHFGINILNAIPLVDIVWGEKSESETDEYSGTIRK